MRATSYDPPVEPTALEKGILEWLASFHALPGLAEQASLCRVSVREDSGIGFFTTLVLPPFAPLNLPGNSQLVLDGCVVVAPELTHGADCLLFAQQGKITLLEVVAFDKGNPSHLSRWKVVPHGPERWYTWDETIF